MWKNDIKCKYMFMFTLKNLARKGLNFLFCFFPGAHWDGYPQGLRLALQVRHLVLAAWRELLHVRHLTAASQAHSAAASSETVDIKRTLNHHLCTKLAGCAQERFYFLKRFLYPHDCLESSLKTTSHHVPEVMYLEFSVFCGFHTSN